MIVDIETFSDTDFFQNYVYKTQAGAVISLAGFVLHMMVRHQADEATIFMEFTSAENGGIIITDAPNGAFSLGIPQAKLLLLPVGTYVHSLIKSDPQLRRNEMWRGILVHAAGPTRWQAGVQ